MLVLCDALRMIESGVGSGACIDLTRRAEEATVSQASSYFSRVLFTMPLKRTRSGCRRPRFMDTRRHATESEQHRC